MSSNLPINIEKHLFAGGDWMLPGVDDEQCEGATFHSPRPMFTHDTSLVLREWWPKDSPQAYWAWAPHVYLCGVCVDNLTILLRMLHQADGDLPWPIRREFGNTLRALGMRGWEWFQDHRPATSVST